MSRGTNQKENLTRPPPRLEYEMTFAERIEGPLGFRIGSPSRLCWKIAEATLADGRRLAGMCQAGQPPRGQGRGGSWRAGRRLSGRPGALKGGKARHRLPGSRPGAEAQAVAGGRVTESSGGMPRYGSISTRASWPVQPWLRAEEGRLAVSTLGLP